MRVVRRVINHKYTTVNPNILIVGSVINFDCYIKRFADYVIIIEAGTFITSELAHLINQNQDIYIAVHEMEKVKVYSTQFGRDVSNAESNNVRSIEDVIPSILSLKEKVKNIKNFDQQIAITYQTTVNLMEAVFNRKSETLPLNALFTAIETLVECLNHDELNPMPIVLSLMPHEYSTHHHSVNVAIFSIILAKTLGFTKEDLLDIAYAGLLHDIGKIRIDRFILLKPTSLEDDEFDLIKRHSEFGLEILQNNGIANQKVLDGVRFHHEKLDGSGYPEKLRGIRIPKFARIIGMCDVFDALTTRRTYRSNYSSYEALMVIKQEMAEQFDIRYTDAFIRLLGSK